MADNIIKTYPNEPGGNIQLESIPTQLRDAVMGRYMDAFSRLENKVHLATGCIMQIDLPLLSNVFAVLMTRQSIDLLDAMAQTHLTQEGAERVHRICERLGRRNMRRNHIVHGCWMQIVVIADEGVTQEWVRQYPHANPMVRGALYTDPKVAGMYSFTIPELDKATGHVEEMLQAISTLIRDLPSLRLPPQVPEESTVA